MKRALRTKSVGTKVSEAELRVLESRAAAATAVEAVVEAAVRELQAPPRGPTR